jgi:hypothetical protein
MNARIETRLDYILAGGKIVARNPRREKATTKQQDEQ